MSETCHQCEDDPRHCDTRERLLNAAEHLFAENGLAETSLRAITAEAGANIASVNYHFGSKEALFYAVIARRLGPMNDERLRRLEAVEAVAEDSSPSLEQIVRAFISPIIELQRTPQGELFVRLMGRVHAEPGGWMLSVLEQFKDSFERFEAAFKRALPEMPDEEILWRMFFLVGVTAHTAAAGFKLRYFAGERCDFQDVERIADRLTAFAAAGFAAPVAPLEGAAT